MEEEGGREEGGRKEGGRRAINMDFLFITEATMN